MPKTVQTWNCCLYLWRYFMHLSAKFRPDILWAFFRAVVFATSDFIIPRLLAAAVDMEPQDFQQLMFDVSGHPRHASMLQACRNKGRVPESHCTVWTNTSSINNDPMAAKPMCRRHGPWRFATIHRCYHELWDPRSCQLSRGLAMVEGCLVGYVSDNTMIIPIQSNSDCQAVLMFDIIATHCK